MNKKQVFIVGGGIGGLAAALSLSQQGFLVSVFEQTSFFAEVGAGIQLSPNCTRVLFDLGLEAAIRDVGFLPEAGEMRDWQGGKVISETLFGQQSITDFGFPYFHVHRADLIMVLSTAALADKNISLITSAPISAVSQTTLGVRVKTVAGVEYNGDVLVGADGIHSVVRANLFGETEPDFTGNVAWRALVPAAALPQGLIKPTATAWWGPGAHFVHYYVRQGELVNCVCVVEKSGWQLESWTEQGDINELKADFSGWHQDVQLLINNIEPDSLFKWALFDRSPMNRWSEGRATLLGDACHPTLPFMAQGAAMAIEDGAVLARCLTRDESVETNLQFYQSLRISRTASIQNGSRRNAKVFHMSGMAAKLRNVAAKTASGLALKKVYAYDALSAHLIK